MSSSIVWRVLGQEVGGGGGGRCAWVQWWCGGGSDNYALDFFPMLLNGFLHLINIQLTCQNSHLSPWIIVFILNKNIN